jgi:hypothetical protein
MNEEGAGRFARTMVGSTDVDDDTTFHRTRSEIIMTTRKRRLS